MEASPTPPPAPAAKRIGAGDVVSETFSVYRENFGALFGSALAVFVVVGICEWLLAEIGGWVLGLVAAAIYLAGHALYVGFVVKLVEDTRDGRRDFAVGDLFSAASPFILPLIAFGLLFSIGVFVGAIFLIVPGLILLTFWSVGAPAIVVEDEGPIGAFGRSWNLVRGEAWSVFGVLVLVFLIVLGIGIVLAVIATPIGDGEVATGVASIISGALTAPIYALAVSILYFELGGGDRTAPAAAAQPGTPPPPPPPPPSA
jgi:hypothetical protein